jgi:diacylglycerol kinase (ATP)
VAQAFQLQGVMCIEKKLVIWNSNAGSTSQAEDIRNHIADSLDTIIYEPTSAADAQEKIRIECERGTKLVIAAGGDGTVNSVVNGLANAPAEVVMGVLPLGTANDWCASLAIPSDIDAAWETLENRLVVPLDVVELRTSTETTRFANIATGGNSHRITEAITSELKQRWGAMCYIRGAVGILNDLQSFETSISFDGGPTELFSVWNLIAANGRTSAGRVEVAPQACLDDGLLDVVIIQSGTMVNLADLSVRYVFADYIKSDQVVYRQARQITLSSNPPIKFSIDGDLVEHQPISLTCLPAALNVIVGSEFSRST